MNGSKERPPAQKNDKPRQPHDRKPKSTGSVAARRTKHCSRRQRRPSACVGLVREGQAAVFVCGCIPSAYKGRVAARRTKHGGGGQGRQAAPSPKERHPVLFYITPFFEGAAHKSRPQGPPNPKSKGKAHISARRFQKKCYVI